MVPKVSVIIPTYNRELTLSRAIESVLEQSFTDFELIIVDDGSTDGTSELLANYASDFRVRKFTTDNRGVSAARNCGIRQALGTWVAFLDSDDEWLPEKLERQLKLLKQNEDLRWVHGEEIWIRNGVRVNPMKKHQKSGGDVFADATRLCCVSPSTVLIHKSLFAEVGFFKEDYPVCEDYDLWLRIAKAYPIGFVKEPVIRKYGGHEDQLSRKFFAMDYWRVKALSDLVDNGNLKPNQQEMAQSEILHKAGVLLKGYRKHENLAEFDEVFRIRSQTRLYRQPPKR